MRGSIPLSPTTEGTEKWFSTRFEPLGGVNSARRSIRLPSALACPEDWCRDYESRLGSSTLPRAAYGECGNMGVALALHASQMCGSIPPFSTYAVVVELVDTTDLKSVGRYARGGSSPPFRTDLLSGWLPSFR